VQSHLYILLKLLGWPRCCALGRRLAYHPLCTSDKSCTEGKQQKSSLWQTSF